MLKYIACTLLLITAPPISRAAIVFNSRCIQAYHHILCLKVKEASALLAKEKQENPSNDAPYLLENSIDYIITFTQEKKEDFERLKKFEDERLERIKNSDPSSPWYRYALAEIYLECGFVQFKFKEYVSAAYQIRKGYKLLEENTKLPPQFKASYKLLSFLHAAIGSVPDSYQWIVNTLGMKGTIQQGMQEIAQLNSSLKGSSYEFIGPESNLIEGMLMHYINKDYKNAQLAYSKVFDGKVYSPLVTFARVNTNIILGKNEEALRILDQAPVNDPSYYPLPILDYQHGMLKLFKLETDAGAYFVKYTITFKGNTYAKAALQKIAWTYLLQNNLAKYHEYINKCKTGVEAITDEDKQALTEATTGEIPNVELLKSRLLTDGNNLAKALEILSEMDMNKLVRLKDKVEYTYRLGRVYQKKGDLPKTERFYNQTITLGKAERYYFAANAALEMGSMYELHGDKTNARKYFKLCLMMKNHDYQNGIDQKAKAGLNRIGDY